MQVERACFLSAIIAVDGNVSLAKFQRGGKESTDSFRYVPFKVLSTWFQLVTPGEYVGCDLESVLWHEWKNVIQQDFSVTGLSPVEWYGHYSLLGFFVVGNHVGVWHMHIRKECTALVQNPFCPYQQVWSLLLARQNSLWPSAYLLMPTHPAWIPEPGSFPGCHMHIYWIIVLDISEALHLLSRP